MAETHTHIWSKKERPNIPQIKETLISAKIGPSLKPFSMDCRKTKIKLITKANQNKEKYHKEPMTTQSEITSHYLQHRETRLTKKRLVQVSHSIGWKDDTSFIVQSWGVVKKSQCNCGFCSTLHRKIVLKLRVETPYKVPFTKLTLCSKP